MPLERLARARRSMRLSIDRSEADDSANQRRPHMPVEFSFSFDPFWISGSREMAISFCSFHAKKEIANSAPRTREAKWTSESKSAPGGDPRGGLRPRPKGYERVHFFFLPIGIWKGIR